MNPPRLPSLFRNVRHAPRNFKFRSAHVDARTLRWKDRKEAIEQEVEGASPDSAPRKLRFRTDGGTRTERQGRLAGLRRSRRRAMLRSVVILMVLLYAAWLGLKWVETTDFAKEFLMTAPG
jgi:hypothetical protein